VFGFFVVDMYCFFRFSDISLFYRLYLFVFFIWMVSFVSCYFWWVQLLIILLFFCVCLVCLFFGYCRLVWRVVVCVLGLVCVQGHRFLVGWSFWFKGLPFVFCDSFIFCLPCCFILLLGFVDVLLCFLFCFVVFVVSFLVCFV